MDVSAARETELIKSALQWHPFQKKCFKLIKTKNLKLIKIN